MIKRFALFAGIIIFGSSILLSNILNKNEKLAAAMGLIFSVFALVYYIFVAARGSSSESGEYVTCTECKEVFVSSKLFCPKCKKKVNTKSIKKVK